MKHLVLLGTAALALGARESVERSTAPTPPFPPSVVAREITITDLGTLGGSSAHAAAINGLGHVAGQSSTASGTIHGFIWTPEGGMHDLGTLPGGVQSVAGDINDLGQVVGRSNRAFQFHPRAFLGTAAGGMIDLGTLGGCCSEAYAINNLGHVVGRAATAAGQYHAFLWTAGTGMIDLDASNSAASVATDINDLGQIVGLNGSRAVLWMPDGHMVDLQALGLDGVPAAMNNAGQIVGVTDTRSGMRAYLWSETGGMTLLGALGGGQSYSAASGINDLGQVVGQAQDALGRWRPFLWTAVRGMIDLGTLGGTWATTNLNLASDINEGGQIAGRSETPTVFEVHATRWELVLDPATPNGQIQALVSDVERLVSLGRMTVGQASGLAAKLDAASRQLDSGSRRAAVKLLEAFVVQVEAYVRNGTLPAADGQGLVDGAQAIIVELSGQIT